MTRRATRVAGPLLLTTFAGITAMVALAATPPPAAVTQSPAMTPPSAASPGPPGAEIYVAPLRISGDSIAVGAALNITGRPGYDNQPSFTPDGRAVLFTSIRGDGQADVYRYDLGAGTSARVTMTSESEYSPTVMPGDSTISVVRVERDSTQRLWAFDLSGGNPRLLLDGQKPVGYHAWSDAGHVALFILGEPHRLHFADLATGGADTLARDIGRSMHRIPGGSAISFVQKSDAGWWIERFDPATGAISRIAPTLPGIEDHAWTPGGRILAAREHTLYAWRGAAVDTAGRWEPVQALPLPGAGSVTRLAVSPSGDRIAMVAQEP